jgi:general stress protein 26
MPRDARHDERHDDTEAAEATVDAIWRRAEAIGTCLLVTWDGHAQRARPRAVRPDRDAGLLYLLADADDPDLDEIERFPIVTLAFADIAAGAYLAITGRATVGDDPTRIAALWTEADADRWPGPVDGDVRLVTIEPGDAELWDAPDRPGARVPLAAPAGLDGGEAGPP